MERFCSNKFFNCTSPSQKKIDAFTWQHLFPKMLPLKWICCCKESLMYRMICKNPLFYSYFLREHTFWIFVRIASVRRLQQISKTCVAWSFNAIFLHNFSLTVTSWAKVSWHSKCHIMNFVVVSSVGIKRIDYFSKSESFPLKVNTFPIIAKHDPIHNVNSASKVVQGKNNYPKFHHYLNIASDKMITEVIFSVDSCYLKVQGTLWNTSRHPFLNISDLQHWVKNKLKNKLK